MSASAAHMSSCTRRINSCVSAEATSPAGTGGSFYHVLVQTVDMIRGYVCEMIGVTSADMHYNHNNLE